MPSADFECAAQLPEKQLFGKMSPSLVKERATGIEHYLKEISKNKNLLRIPFVRQFLKIPMTAEEVQDLDEEFASECSVHACKSLDLARLSSMERASCPIQLLAPISHALADAGHFSVCPQTARRVCCRAMGSSRVYSSSHESRRLSASTTPKKRKRLRVRRRWQEPRR